MAKEVDFGEYEQHYDKTKSNSSFLNSVFMSTVNSAAKTLVSTAEASSSQKVGKWKPSDHFRFMLMLMTWLTLWVLRVLMDNFPSFSGLGLLSASCAPFNLLQAFSPIGLIDLSGSSSSSMDLVLHQGVEDVPVQALARSLSHILFLINEIPATSGKYQFATAMAETIMEENARSCHDEMLYVNRTALALAFERTSSLLHRAVEKNLPGGDHENKFSSSFAARAIHALPMGSHVATYIKGLRACVGAVKSCVEVIATCRSQRTRRAGIAGCGGRVIWEEEDEEGRELVGEKLAEELFWISNKLRAYGAVDEALVQWSFASGLASLALATNPRVQALLVKISAVLFVDVNREDVMVTREVKFRLLLLWLPLFCHANNGMSYPILSHFKKIELEKAINEAIWSLPAVDQEVILTNWIQDFAISPSDWPNLQLSYDRWCQTTRNLALP
ncbi:hypothetical protein UlMin_010827 [Ulmus minor]